MPRVIPMVSYEDAGAAADWLCSSFGFVEEGRYTQDGRVTHANLVLGDGAVMVGWPGPHYRSPRHHGEQCAEARRWLDSPYVVDGVHVRVDDIDAHYQRALEAGARMLSPLEDNEPVGQRQYRAEDIEGHRWMFAQPL